MPKVSEHREARLRRIIRDAMAIDPLISLTGVKRVLDEKTGAQGMDINYVRKLIKKVTGEMAVVADREKVEERITYLRERNRMICDELLRMAFPSPTMIPQPELIDRRKALEAIARIEKDQVKLEMDLGLFTRHLGQLNVDHRLKPMDEMTLKGVVAAFKAWGVIPPQMRRIEPERMIEAKATVITHEPTEPQPKQSKPHSQPIPAVSGAGLVPAE